MKIKEFLMDTKLEITKVTWPDRKKVMSLVVVIFVILTLVSLYVFVLDSALSFGIGAIERIKF